MEIIMTEINSCMREFQQWSENNLTLVQRRRKIGAGIRNYGFIEKVADLASANPQYAQFFNVVDLRNAIKNVDMCRDLVLLLQGFQRMVSNSMLVYSDDAFTMATIFYRMVQTMSRRGDPQAIQLFRTLSPFFTPRNKRANAEPTTKEIEQHLHALLHGVRLSTPTRGVDEKSLQDVALNKRLQDEQRREVFRPSSAPGTTEKLPIAA
jgi:hypothetical protein